MLAKVAFLVNVGLQTKLLNKWAILFVLFDAEVFSRENFSPFFKVHSLGTFFRTPTPADLDSMYGGRSGLEMRRGRRMAYFPVSHYATLRLLFILTAIFGNWRDCARSISANN